MILEPVLGDPQDLDSIPMILSYSQNCYYYNECIGLHGVSLGVGNTSRIVHDAMAAIFFLWQVANFSTRKIAEINCILRELVHGIIM